MSKSRVGLRVGVGRRGVTLVEVLFVAVMVLLGVGAAKIAGKVWGNGWVSAAAFVVGAAAIPIGLWGLVFVESRVRPRLPVCRRGRCRGWEYVEEKVIDTKYVDPTKEPRASVLRCRCGDEYVRMEPRLLVVSADGKRWESFRRRPPGVQGGTEWQEDTEPGVDADVTAVIWEKGK